MRFLTTRGANPEHKYLGNDAWACGHVDNLPMDGVCDCDCRLHDHETRCGFMFNDTRCGLIMGHDGAHVSTDALIGSNGFEGLIYDDVR